MCPFSVSGHCVHVCTHDASGAAWERHCAAPAKQLSLITSQYQYYCQFYFQRMFMHSLHVGCLLNVLCILFVLAEAHSLHASQGHSLSACACFRYILKLNIRMRSQGRSSHPSVHEHSASAGGGRAAHAVERERPAPPEQAKAAEAR